MKTAPTTRTCGRGGHEWIGTQRHPARTDWATHQVTADTEDYGVMCAGCAGALGESLVSQYDEIIVRVIAAAPASLSDAPLEIPEEVGERVRGVLDVYATKFGLAPHPPPIAPLLDDLFSFLYQGTGGGSHTERQGRVHDYIDRTAAAWEAEMEEARNQRHYDEKGEHDDYD